ncbi:MAG: response regulator transcription factor [Lachnospiraceae bacterium]|nr:response regulator transcription factor [Lachnospiraceae bacterium]
MIKVAIVEDSKESADILNTYLKRTEDEGGNTFVVSFFSDALDFLDRYSGYDLVFMDIEMPYMNGLDGAKKLRQIDNQAVLIFVTNMANYAVRGYEVDALDFIVKPVKYADFSFKLNRALHVIDGRKTKEITIVHKNGVKRFSVSDLIYVEISGHQLSYVFENEVFTIRGKMTDAEGLLKDYGFLRPHNAYLINSDYIDEVQGYEVKIGDFIIPISRPRRKAFLQDIAILYGRGGM